MSFSHYMANADAPGAGALFWDNLKTTVLQGGRVTGVVTGVLGGVAGGIFACPVGSPQVGAGIGYIVTSIPAGIAGSITGLLLSPGFTIAAMLTRDFKINEEIDPHVAQILSFGNNEHYQRYIINQIIQEFKNLEWWRIVSSHESRKLMDSLTEGYLQDGWKALTNYITKSEPSCFSGSCYEHNGKKTLDIIISVAKKLQPKRDLLDALENLDEEKIKTLIQDHPELITETITGRENLFQILVLDNNIEAVKLLLRINVITKEMLNSKVDYDSTLLYQTVKNGHQEMAKILLDAGVNEANKHDSCDHAHIIHLAAKKGLTEIVEKLVNKYNNGIDFPDKNNSNKTPLHYAAEYGHEDLVRSLVQKNADVNLQSKYGKTPVQLARMNNHHSIANYLVNEGHAIDHDYIQLQKELTILYDVIHHADWEKQGFSFKLFTDSNCLPDGIVWARKNFPDPEHLGRDEIFTLAQNLKCHDFGFSLTRSQDAKILYQLFGKLGKNDDESFAQLSAYRGGVKPVFAAHSLLHSQ
jgi:Ankyrin repeats (3 copies)